MKPSSFIPEETSKRISLLAILGIVVIGIAYLDSERTSRAPSLGVESSPLARTSENTGAKSLLYPPAEEFVKPGKFINTSPFALKDLIGKKVILLDFWTYSCINCQRTTPYLNAWWEKYKDEGLAIVGVHTPEFGFEKEYENVLAAVRKMGIGFPVVQDNNFDTWNAYQNHYWPHKYLIDIDGYIVYDHIGEGGYEETEEKIQELLLERSERLGEEPVVSGGMVAPREATVVEAGKVRSPEIYFGAGRNEYLANGNPGSVSVQTLTVPEDIQINSLYLGGNWGFRDEFAHVTKAPARIVFRYSARDVHMVASAEKNIRVKVLLDGRLIPKEMRGSDVDKNGFLNIKVDRLYNVVRDSAGYGEHTLELQIEAPALRVFTFTFG